MINIKNKQNLDIYYICGMGMMKKSNSSGITIRFLGD